MGTQKSTLSKKIMALWPTKTIAVNVAGVFVTYMTFYATNYMGLSATTVGIIFMLSKIFDGITDFAAGVIIDRTRTKWGQARPYDLAIIGYWAAIVLFYSAPDLGINASYIYLFIMYTLVHSVFSTLISCNEAPYLSNVLSNTADSVKLVSVASIVSMIASIGSAIAIPQMISSIGTTKAGWTTISLILAIPMILVGIMRFIFIREVRLTEKSEEEKMNLKTDLKYLIHNKYIIIFAVILLFSNICSNSLSQNYYCEIILGDVGYTSVMAASLCALFPVMLLMPKLSEKFGTVKVLMAYAIIGAFGFLIRLLAPTSIPLLFVANCLSSLGYYPTWFISSAVIVDGMDYGEWKFGRRAQGTLGCLSGIAGKLGTALGAGLLGVLMGLSGYDGVAEVQTASANNMIIALYSVIPAILCVIMAVLCGFYDLDKKLPQIRKELQERRDNL